jgi:eukaryotic-like serine/threonine-protein kinase
MRLAKRYRLREPIASGGMGHIYRALDERLDREVAIKVLDPDPSAAEPSILEARATARLAHPGLVQVFDVGSEDGLEYIVMELVPGRSLRELLAARRRLTPAETVSIGAQLADALAYVHRQGLVHCDVKPRNVMLTPDGTVKLLDFGIAEGTDSTRTLPLGEVRGSAAYISPEQARGERPDARSDIYALGILLYELLAGHPPFTGPDVHTVVVQRLVADPPRLRPSNPQVPGALEQVVLTALARDPAARYQSASDLSDALSRALTVGVRTPRKRLVAGVPAALALVLATGLAVTLSQRSTTQAPADTPANAGPTATAPTALDSRPAAPTTAPTPAPTTAPTPVPSSLPAVPPPASPTLVRTSAPTPAPTTRPVAPALPKPVIVVVPQPRNPSNGRDEEHNGRGHD